MNLRLLMSTLVVVGGAAVATPTLVAEASFGDCPTNRACLWSATNAGGDLMSTRPSGQTYVNVSDFVDNRTSSWWNNTMVGARWWQLPDRGGFCVPMPAGVQQNYTQGDGFNDKLSSWATNGSSCA